ncbi:hypothetical protein F7734_54610 [Scytonema sp. UIC 10036]|uniref:hypothetical protein n=1 Tax=Scytonema sp. UIC 10036 TaxID=2304196 RepID=UPI0012DAE182|nr:hypothetical protein [Scytonema sp. UIC 10036]MUH00832.1 hypothetical protein [Scytonema sp. UIC 10036]
MIVVWAISWVQLAPKAIATLPQCPMPNAQHPTPNARYSVYRVHRESTPRPLPIPNPQHPTPNPQSPTLSPQFQKCFKANLHHVHFQSPIPSPQTQKCFKANLHRVHCVYCDPEISHFRDPTTLKSN